MNQFLDMQILRDWLAKHPPGSTERFDLLHKAKQDHHHDVILRNDEKLGSREEQKERDLLKRCTAERQWIDDVSTFVPSNPQRITVPDGLGTDVQLAHRRMLSDLPIGTLTRLLMSSAIWQDGGGLLMFELVEILIQRDLYKFSDDEVWLNVLRCTNKNPDGGGHLPTIERAWHLLDVAMGIYRRRIADENGWRRSRGWFTPNAMVNLAKRGWADGPGTAVDLPMQALVKRYVDHRYDMALSNLLATARRDRSPRGTRRIRRRLSELRNHAHYSIDHLERWTAVRDHLVEMGITTVPRANWMLLCYVLAGPMLHDDDAMRWTLRLLDEGMEDDTARSSTLYHAVTAAAESGWTDIVDVLLERGADLTGRCGVEAVLGALQCEQYTAVEHLLTRGVRIRDVESFVNGARFGCSHYAEIDRNHLGDVLRAWERKALCHEVEEVVADLPVQRAVRRRL